MKAFIFITFATLTMHTENPYILFSGAVICLVLILKEFIKK